MHEVNTRRVGPRVRTRLFRRAASSRFSPTPSAEGDSLVRWHEEGNPSMEESTRRDRTDRSLRRERNRVRVSAPARACDLPGYNTRALSSR